MDTKTLDKLYLEISQITTARTRKEIIARSTIKSLIDIIEKKLGGGKVELVITNAKLFIETI